MNDPQSAKEGGNNRATPGNLILHPTPIRVFPAFSRVFHQTVARFVVDAARKLAIMTLTVDSHRNDRQGLETLCENLKWYPNNRPWGRLSVHVLKLRSGKPGSKKHAAVSHCFQAG